MNQANTQSPRDERAFRRLYRKRVAIFVFGSIVVCLFLAPLYDTVQTMARLDSVEHGRDTWQRPDVVLKELNVKDGGVVVDLGCGVGYFTLKASDQVENTGKVLAVDVLRYPLYVLRTRALFSGRRNIETVHGAVDDPHLPINAVDAVLIVNTYHELTASTAILAHLHDTLKRDARLVIVDRSPNDLRGLGEPEAGHHEIAAARVARDLIAAGFEIIRRDDHFVDPPQEGHIWWLIVARKRIDRTNTEGEQPPKGLTGVQSSHSAYQIPGGVNR